MAIPQTFALNPTVQWELKKYWMETTLTIRKHRLERRAIHGLGSRTV